MKTYKGPWEHDAVLPTPPPHYRSHTRFTPVFVTLAIIAIVVGGLIAWSQLS